jgi:hypothetical protein
MKMLDEIMVPSALYEHPPSGIDEIGHVKDEQVWHCDGGKVF